MTSLEPDLCLSVPISLVFPSLPPSLILYEVKAAGVVDGVVATATIAAFAVDDAVAANATAINPRCGAAAGTADIASDGGGGRGGCPSCRGGR